MIIKKLLIGSLIVASATTCALAAPTVLDSTAAVVNNDIILESELNAATRQVMNNASRQKVALDPIAARKAAMEHLVTNTLVLQLAKQRGIELTDMQLDTALQETAAKNQTTPEKLLEGIAPGQSVAAQRETFRNEFMINEFRRSGVRARINVSDAEVNSLAQQLKKQGSVEPRYHLGMIVVPLAANPTEAQYNQAQAQAAAVKRELASGASFASVAARYSRDASASKGGDMGYVPETRVPMGFLPSVVKAKPGDLIGPIRSPIGLHFMKVFDVSHDAVEPVKTYNAAHILIKPSIILSDDAARSQLIKIRQDIINGQYSFADAAKRYSEDAGSASQGGDLGYQVPGIFDPNFARAMVGLDKGQISEPIHSSFGWHIITLKDVKVDASSDEAYKSRAREILFERAFQEQAGLWEQQLRDSAYVHITDPELLSAGVNMEHQKDEGAAN